MKYSLMDEKTPETCGFDFQSFDDGWDCPQPTSKVILEDGWGHFAHLCEEHATVELERLNALQEVSDGG